MTITFDENFQCLAPFFLDSWLNIKMKFMKIFSTPNFTLITQFFGSFSKNLKNF